MAERRMFTKKITDDDNFVMLSSSAQALYFHLNMQSDDDGFCNQINASMFKAHASVEDLKSLLERRYIYQFEDGVIVIKHWRMANALRKDRYTPTSFQEDFAKLDIKDNGSYTLKEDGCHMVANRLPQVRIGKDSIGKDIDYMSEFESIWDMYPKKQGKTNAFKAFQKALKEGEKIEDIKAGLQAFKAYLQALNVDSQYIPMGSTWFNQRRWNDDYTITRTRKGNYFAPTGHEDEYTRVNQEIEIEPLEDASEEELLALGIGTKIGG